MVYTYDAAGNKLRQQVLDANQTVKKTTDYVGEGIYEDGLIQFLNNEEGRVVLTWTPEYQLHLKDHLGNVRLTLTTVPEVEKSTATLETASELTEQSNFLYYDEAVKINHFLFDHTQDLVNPLPQGATTYATRLTGGNTNSIYGLARSISVMPGDVISAEVWAKYVDPNSTNWNSLFNTFMNSIQPGGGAATGTLIDGGLAGSLGGATFPFLGLLTKEEENENGPKAYLNYIVFDRNYQFLTGGFKRLSSDPKETGENVAHEALAFARDEAIHIKEPGYIYIYLSNENDTSMKCILMTSR